MRSIVIRTLVRIHCNNIDAAKPRHSRTTNHEPPSHRILNPFDSPAGNNDHVKSGRANPSNAAQIQFGRRAQSLLLSIRYRIHAGHHIGPIFYFDKQNQIATPGNYINFGAAGMATGNISRFQNSKSAKPQKLTRQPFRKNPGPVCIFHPPLQITILSDRVISDKSDKVNVFALRAHWLSLLAEYSNMHPLYH